MSRNVRENFTATCDVFLQKLSLDTEEKLQELESPAVDVKSVSRSNIAVSGLSAMQLARQQWELNSEVSF